MLNYCEWSKEYSQTAEEIEQVINKLKAQKRGASLSKKKEIDAKLSKYRSYYNECVETANILMNRYRGVAWWEQR